MSKNKTKQHCTCEKCTCGENCACKNCSKKSKKCDEYCSRNGVFAACFLACAITAVLVALFFSLSFTLLFGHQYRAARGVNERNFSGMFNDESAIVTNGKILQLSTGATIDFFVSGHTGFIYVSADDCGARCAEFESRLTAAATEKDVTNQVFHYNYPTYNSPNANDRYAAALTIASDEAPVLLYVKGGHVYDRLDEMNGDLAVATFLAKYK